MEDSHRLGQPIHFLSGQEAEPKGWLGWIGCPTRRFTGRLDLSQRQARLIEEDAAGSSELNAPRAADHEWDADLVFQIPHLTA